MLPPATNRFNGKFGGVVIHSYTHPTLITCGIVHVIRTNLTQLRVRKIIELHLLRLPLRLVFTPFISKNTYLFFLFCVNRNYRLPSTLKHLYATVDICLLYTSPSPRDSA